MGRAKENDDSGRDHFARIYEQELDLEARWLQYGAIEKANSIALLLRETHHRAGSVLELGCGPGEVILECQRRGIGQSFTAIDFSEAAVQRLQLRAPDIRCIVADIASPHFALDEHFDVVVLSHVLEHLEDPLGFLRALTRTVRFGCLVAEVPLEDLWGARLKNLVRDRRRNTAGHVQFFDQRSYRQLLTSAGLKIVAERQYAPILTREGIEMVSRKDRLSRLRTLAMHATGRYLPRLMASWWRRFYYAHHAVLCTSAP